MKKAGGKILAQMVEQLPAFEKAGRKHMQRRMEKELAEIFGVVKGGIEEVDRRIVAQEEQFDAGVRSYLRFALDTHGKRLRPSLALFGGGVVNGVTEAHLHLGVVVELIHLASLVHDDIIDEAQLRRGQPTVQRKWGAATAVLIGDCIFAHALMTSTVHFERHISRKIALAANEVCQGEILQTQRRFDFSMTIPEYLKLIEMKTGALFRVSTELGCELGGGTPEQIGAMREFGTCLGTAYQIWDDLVDLFGAENKIGKSLGTDLDKGKLTLPLLLMLDKANETGQEHIRGLMLSEAPSAQVELAGAVRVKGCLNESVEVIDDYLARAEACLAGFGETPHRDALLSMLGYLQRQSVNLLKC